MDSRMVAAAAAADTPLSAVMQPQAGVPLPAVERITRAHRHIAPESATVAGSPDQLQLAVSRPQVTRAVGSATAAEPAAASSAVWAGALVDPGAAATGTAASGQACSGAATLPGSCPYCPRSAPPTGGTRCLTTTT